MYFDPKGLPPRNLEVEVSDSMKLDCRQFLCFKMSTGESLHLENVFLGGGFQYLLFSSLPGEMIQFD